MLTVLYIPGIGILPLSIERGRLYIENNYATDKKNSSTRSQDLLMLKKGGSAVEKVGYCKTRYAAALIINYGPCVRVIHYFIKFLCENGMKSLIIEQ